MNIKNLIDRLNGHKIHECQEAADALEELSKQRDELLKKVAAWEQKAANWMASPEAAQRLDGYRDLAQRLNAAEMQRDELNRLCEFNEKTMQFMLDVIQHSVDEAKLTSSQYELCRQAIASVREEK